MIPFGFILATVLGAACCGASFLWDLLEGNYGKAVADLVLLATVLLVFVLYCRHVTK